MKKPLRYALIGAGSAARLHLNDITKKPDVVLVGIADPLDIKSWRIPVDYANVPRFTDASTLLRDTEPDLVSVCTPNRFHQEHVLNSLASGAHVACEKPMAMSVAEARGMEKARIAAGRLGAINFGFRNVPAFRFGRHLIANGELGRITRVSSVYLQSFQGVATSLWSWRNDVETAGFGAMGDLGVHMIDTVRFLTGSEFRRVVGLTQTVNPEKKDRSGTPHRVTTDTNGTFLAELENLVVATFEASQVAPGYGDYFRVEISGELGTLAVCSEQPDSIYLRAGASMTRYATWKTDIPLQRIPTDFIHEGPPNSPGAIVHAIRGAPVEFPKFSDGLAAQKVLGALQESIKTRAWAAIEEN